MAPEQLDQYPSSALGTDVFQIGLIMFGMLRGSVGGIDLQGGDALGDKSTTKPRPAKRARPTEGEDAEEGGEDAEEGGEDAKGGEDAEEGGENAEEGDGNAEEEEDYEEEYEEEEEDTVQLPDPEIKRVIDRIKSLERSGNLKARGDMVREYSIRLRRLIDRCLKANPRDRISITKLANRTSEEYNEATKSVDDEKMREWVEWVNTVTAPLEFREGRPDHFPLNLGFGRLKHRKRARVR